MVKSSPASILFRNSSTVILRSSVIRSPFIFGYQLGAAILAGHRGGKHMVLHHAASLSASLSGSAFTSFSGPAYSELDDFVVLSDGSGVSTTLLPLKSAFSSDFFPAAFPPSLSSGCLPRSVLGWAVRCWLCSGFSAAASPFVSGTENRRPILNRTASHLTLLALAACSRYGASCSSEATLLSFRNCTIAAF